jgi:hypothetical protein
LNKFINTDWECLLAGVAEFEIRDVDVSLKIPKTRDAPRLKRWLFRGGIYIIYRIGLIISKWLSFLFWQNLNAFILKENELVQETAAFLALKGVKIGQYKVPYDKFGFESSTNKTFVSEIKEETWQRISCLYVNFLETDVTSELRNNLCEMAIDNLKEHSNRQDRMFKRVKKDLKHFPKNSMLLTNYPGTPEAYAIFLAAAELNIPSIAFQHGVSREINQFHGDLGVENSAAHLTFVYNETAKTNSDATQFVHGITKVAGFPSKGKMLKNVPKNMFYQTNPVLYLSTNVYRGTVGSISSAWTDHENCQMEKEIISRVLNTIPIKVSYKPYPFALRYVDPDPVLTEAEKSENIDVINSDIDARYFLRSASLIVTSRATSTTGWAIMSGIPLCFIDISNQMSLPKGVKSDFEDSFFYFSLENISDLVAIRNFLCLPIDEIKQKWDAKISPRTKFIENHISGPQGHAGHRASQAIFECQHYFLSSQLLKPKIVQST